MKTQPIRLLAFLIAASLLTLPAWGDESSFDGSVRLRLEDWKWFEADDADGNYAFLGSLIRVGWKGKTGRVDWRLELAQPAVLGLPDDAIASAPQGQLGLGATYFAVNGRDTDDVGLFLKNGYLKVANIGGTSSWFRAGRFEFIEGVESMPGNGSLAAVKKSRVAHRLIGTFGFTHVGRSFDALQYFHDFGEANLVLFAGRPTEGVFSLDGWDQLDVDLFYTALTRSAENYDSRIFGIAYFDDRGTRLSDNRGTADRGDVEIYTLGAHYLRSFDLATGSGNVLLWAATQTGDWGSQDHDAFAYAIEAGFLPGGKMKPSFRAGWFAGDGDSDPTDGNHETFFQVLPTPRIYARFPFYNLMNTEDMFVEVGFAPSSKVKVKAAIHSIELSEASDLWYVGGGAFNEGAFGYPSRPSNGHTDLADIFDIGVNWSISKSQAASVYIGWANGGSVVKSIYPSGSDGRYAYFEYTKKFGH